MDCEIIVANSITHKGSVNSCLFFEEKGRIVTCSSDNSIRISTLTEKNTIKNEHIIRKESRMNHLIKWKGKFLVCSDDDFVRAFSTNGEYIKKFTISSSEVIKLVQLDGDHFLASNFADELFIISYSKNKITMDLGKEKISRKTKLIPSRRYPNSFYLNTISTINAVKLIDYSKNKVTRIFEIESEIWSIDIFFDSEGEEILVCGTQKGNLIFYHTNKRKLQIREKEDGTSVYKPLKKIKIRGMVPIVSIHCNRKNNSYLFADSGGIVYLIDIRDLNSRSKKVIKQKKIHKKPIREFASVIHESSKLIILLTASEDFTCKITHISLLSSEERKTIRKRFNDSIKRHLTSDNYLKHLYSKERPEVKFRELLNELAKKSVSSVTGQASLEKFSPLLRTLLRTDECFLPIISQKMKGGIDRDSDDNHFWYFGQNTVPRGFGIKLERKSYLLYNHEYFSPTGYIGEFSNRLEDGEGKLYETSEKCVFSGNFCRGKRDGKGVEFAYVPGIRNKTKLKTITFEGLYCQGKREGRGEAHDIKRGEVVRGLWRKGVLDPKSVTMFECPLIHYRDIQKCLKNSCILGSGGFGVVYKVPSSAVLSKSKWKQEFVAVKIMKAATGFHRDLLFRMTRRGIGLCSSIDSPNILKVLGLVTGRREVGYVMEICRITVMTVISSANDEKNQQHLEMKEKVRILKETASGMKSLHEKNVMHRDLKWPNVMLDFDGTVKITDFDTLKEDEMNWRMHSIGATSKIGTQGFIAPEVFNGKKYTLKCDIYAYSLMMYSLIFQCNQPFLSRKKCSCGTDIRHIFLSNSLDYHVSNCELRPLVTEEDIDLVPKYLIDLMKQCWSRDPYKRPSFEEIVQIFESEEKKTKCYSMITLEFPDYKTIHNQQMLLIDPKLEKIGEWVMKKYVGSNVKNIVYKSKILEHDGEIYEIVRNDEEPVFVVEMLDFDEDEKRKKISEFEKHKSPRILVEENHSLKIVNKMLLNRMKDEKRKFERIISKQTEEINRLKEILGIEDEEEVEGED